MQLLNIHCVYLLCCDRFAWAEAIFSWLPTVPRHTVAVMTTGKDFVDDAKILIISYDLLSKNGTELEKRKFNMVILVSVKYL